IFGASREALDIERGFAQASRANAVPNVKGEQIAEQSRFQSLATQCSARPLDASRMHLSCAKCLSTASDPPLSSGLELARVISSYLLVSIWQRACTFRHQRWDARMPRPRV